MPPATKTPGGPSPTASAASHSSWVWGGLNRPRSLCDRHRARQPQGYKLLVMTSF
jgi:hypothetical protein